MLGFLKRTLAQSFPGAVDIYRELLARRQCTPRRVRATAYGFRLAGNERMASPDFERAETRFVLHRLRQARVFVDVGANIGFYSCLARQVGAHVIAVEPSRDNLYCLLFNIHANGWNDIEVLPVGLSDHIGLAGLHGGGTGASMLADWAGTAAASNRVIPLSTMDTVLGDRFAGEPLLVKIDVEGTEFRVVRGTERVLARRPSPVWLVEICLTEHHPKGLNPDFGEVFARFWSHGYEAFSLLVDGSTRLVTREHVTRWVAERRREFGYASYIFERTAP